MFIDRYAAISSYLQRVNIVLAENTITESRSYPLLTSEEAIPSLASGEWDQQVADNDELQFQDLAADGAGYKYLVNSDSLNDGLWAIYEVTAAETIETLQLNRVQAYDTNQYWDTVTWYAADFSPFTKIDYVVAEFTDLATISDPENNAVAKVIHNSVGSWEIYQYIDGNWIRVALENGTIQLSETLWDADATADSATELRQIIKSINEEILIGDIAIERNKALISVFNYVLAEQPTVAWLVKTSLIDVTQNVRGLTQFAVYQKDNQDYLQEYITEAKPYHVKIKDFSQSYDGIDYMYGTVTDFDCPAFFSTEFQQFISPILDDGAALVTDPSNKKPDDEIWQTQPWSEWFQNYALEVDSILVTNGGTGYTIVPEVIVTGTSTTPAVLEAVIGAGGVISEVVVTDPGAGYMAPPVITFAGSDGIGATAIARVANPVVRSIKTVVKYDRYEYASKVATFESNDETTTRNLVFLYTGTLQQAAENNEIPTLYRVTELYTDADDNDIFDATKFEEVPYFLSIDGERQYIDATADTTLISVDSDDFTVDESGGGLDAIERKYMREGIARWYETEDASGAPSGVFLNENDNSESRNFVRYLDAVYKVIEFSPSTEFSSTKYEKIDIDTLGGIDRTTGYYVSDVNNPGLDLALLFDGIAYPGVQVDGSTFGITDDELDVIYASDFTDDYLGTRPEDINVDGGAFIDTYHSHAPEELVPGSIFDTLDLRVLSRPGSDFLADGHGFALNGVVFDVTTSPQTFSFSGITEHPISVLISNITTGAMLYETQDFAIDWPNQEVTITSGITAGDDVKIFVYEIGGGNQLYRGVLTGADISAYATADATTPFADANTVTVDAVTNAFTVPVKNNEITEAIVFVNGVLTTVTTNYIDNYTSAVVLPSPPAATDFITVTIFGASTSSASYPLVELYTYDGSAIDPGSSLDGKNRHNAIVEVNGYRLRPPEAARHIADGTAVDFLFPDSGGYPTDSVSGNEVDVYVNNTLQIPVTDFTNSPTGTGTTRFVTFATAPAAGDIVDVYVRTASDYWYSGTEITFGTAPSNGDTVAVTTFRDVSELDILTQVFQGPTTISEIQVDVFESTDFDTLAFDFDIGVNSSVNIFTLDRPEIVNDNRLWVTLNGERLVIGSGFTVINNNQVVLLVPTIQPTDVVAITSITDNVITNGSTFRLFKDMRDTVGMYRMSDSSTTFLVADLANTDDIIEVNDASVLGEPDLNNAVFGILIVNGERITYRERDTVNNTVSGLRRGTAGTGAPVLHSINDVVTDVSKRSLVEWDYDKIWYEQGTSTASNGVPLQDQTTIPAKFIKT
jgi:hypothetical protein